MVLCLNEMTHETNYPPFSTDNPADGFLPSDAVHQFLLYLFAKANLDVYSQRVTVTIQFEVELSKSLL